ncbi:MAG: class I SAM-dependent methyltransferase [Baekduia sp.]
MSSSDSISPTAHYTGQIWNRNGLSDPELSTWQGRLMYAGIEPAMALSRLTGGPSLEPYLLARHRAIDTLLERSITDDGISQVLEIAAGMSARGLRFTRRHGDALDYIEADLPAMAARKQAALDRIGVTAGGPRVVAVDALAPGDLEALTAGLDPDRGLVVITEGLTSYLTPDALDGLWQRIAAIAAAFSKGRYLADVMPRSAGRSPLVRGGRLVLTAFVRGTVHMHFDDNDDIEAALRTAGFTSASVLPAHEIAPAAGGAASLSLATIADARA